MGYPSLEEILNSARHLTYKNDEELIRTNGFWHVLIFLRHCRLHGNLSASTFNAFDLAEACFDLNGIELPVNRQSRNVYYEAGAAQGRNSAALFRHWQGPRQTYLNRIYTGLVGEGPRQPKLFNASGKTLPVTVSLVDNWVEVLRSNPNHCLLLDERFIYLVTWIFRFGIPFTNGQADSIAQNIDNGTLEIRAGLELNPIPSDSEELYSCLQDYFGLDSSTLSDLFPLKNQQSQLPLLTEENTDDAFSWSESSPIDILVLSRRMQEVFMQRKVEASTNINAETETPENISTYLDGEEVDASYTVDWEEMSNALTQFCPLVGIENSLLRCLAALRAGKFIILLGPPGTGKTELAKYICSIAIQYGVPGYITATATAEWSTFETIGGYLPDTENPALLRFTKNFFTEALSSGKWLVIDELNRSDIDKAFGELFTLFSGEKVRLAFKCNNKPIVLVPPRTDCDELTESPIYQQSDWRMIGTMNTFDKASLFQLSYAFMRRFAFVEIPIPSQTDYRRILEQYMTRLQEQDEVFREECFGYLDAVFSRGSDNTLSGIGLGVGPAIAIDIVNFLRERYLIDLEQDQQIDAKGMILEGLEMYLYPQFEGKDRYHLDVIEAVQAALGLTDEEKEQTSRRLAVWTGYEP